MAENSHFYFKMAMPVLVLELQGGKKIRMSLLLFLTRPTHRKTDANLYPPKRQLTKASEPSFDLEGGAQGQT